MCARMLIVDDDPDIVMALKNRVSWMGHEPLTASDGEEALRLIQQEQPDVVLLDIIPPVYSVSTCCKPNDMAQSNSSADATSLHQIRDAAVCRMKLVLCQIV
jgi:DNA-binding response OmpR family regulator